MSHCHHVPRHRRPAVVMPRDRPLSLLVNCLLRRRPRCRCLTSAVGRPRRGTRGRKCRRSNHEVRRHTTRFTGRRGRRTALKGEALRRHDRVLFKPLPLWQWWHRNNPLWHRCWPWRVPLRLRCQRRSRFIVGGAKQRLMRLKIVRFSTIVVCVTIQGIPHLRDRKSVV